MGKPLLFPITAFVGANGHGKTLGAVELAVLPALAQGRPVLSNIRIRHDLWVPLTSWRQLIEFKGGVILLDEINSVLPSREYRSLPAQLARVTNQLRKVDNVLVWTAPAWQRADTMLREVTQGVYVCRGWVPDRYRRAPGRYRFPRSGRAVGDVKDGWAPNRLFRWDLYDAIAMEEFSMGRAEKIGRKAGRWYWRPGNQAHAMYDTAEQVLLMDHLDDTGVCVQCGGTRRRHACKCGKDHSHVDEETGEITVAA